MSNKEESSGKTCNISQILGPSCKSTESRTQFRVCFRNLSENDASIYWIDFNGRPVLYGIIRKGKSSGRGLDIDTYVSHPWIAVDRRRKQLLAINFERVFRPMTSRDFLMESVKIDRLRALPQHQDGCASEQSMEIQPLTEGQHVDAFITDMVLKLELSCCLKVCKMLTLNEVKELEIPAHIQERIIHIYDNWLVK